MAFYRTASNLPDAMTHNKSSANGLQRYQICLAKCSSGQSMRFTSSLQGTKEATGSLVLQQTADIDCLVATLYGGYWGSHIKHRQIINGEHICCAREASQWLDARLFVIWYKDTPSSAMQYGHCVSLCSDLSSINMNESTWPVLKSRENSQSWTLSAEQTQKYCI